MKEGWTERGRNLSAQAVAVSLTNAPRWQGVVGVGCVQWRNRRGGGRGGRVPPQRLLTGKFLMTYREKRGKEKMEKGWKLIRKGGKLEMKAGKRSKKRWGLFFFFFFFFCFSLWKRRKFVLGLPNWEFSTGKKAFHAGKKIRKNDFAPSEKYACYAPGGVCVCVFSH